MSLSWLNGEREGEEASIDAKSDEEAEIERNVRRFEGGDDSTSMVGGG